MTDDDLALDLLLDLNFAHVAVSKYPLSLRDSAAQVFKLQISKLHNLEPDNLDSLVWDMQNDLDRYNSLYKRLIDSLENLESKLSKENESKPKIPYQEYQDSLKASRKR